MTKLVNVSDCFIVEMLLFFVCLFFFPALAATGSCLGEFLSSRAIPNLLLNGFSNYEVVNGLNSSVLGVGEIRLEAMFRVNVFLF